MKKLLLALTLMVCSCLLISCESGVSGGSTVGYDDVDDSDWKKNEIVFNEYDYEDLSTEYNISDDLSK